MAERTNAQLLKSCEAQASEGSNPSPSALWPVERAPFDPRPSGQTGRHPYPTRESLAGTTSIPPAAASPVHGVELPSPAALIAAPAFALQSTVPVSSSRP